MSTVSAPATTPMAAPALGTGAARVYVRAADSGLAAAVAGLLRPTAISQVDLAELTPDTVVLAAARTVEQAVAACDGPWWTGRHPLLAVAETVTPAGARAGVRAGATAILRYAETSPAQLAAAVHAARHGDGRVPHQMLVRLISAPPPAPAGGAPAVVRTALTRQQTAVLRLIAEGHGNAAIADQLHCSEHTVKNAIYDLMARLQVRNRSHAVASAIRAGLI